MNIKKVTKENENSFTVIMNDSDNILTYPIEENCPICKYIEENKDNGMFEYIENYTTLDGLVLNKSNECKKFYDDLRNITIKNGASGEFKCNQDLTNSIESWITDVSSRETKVYEYLYKDLVIHIPLESCIKLRLYVSKIRNFCASLSSYHVFQIEKLQSKADIDNYNYQIDNHGKPVEKFADFIV